MSYYQKTHAASIQNKFLIHQEEVLAELRGRYNRLWEGADITHGRNNRYTATTSGPTKPSCRETRPPAPQMLPKSGQTRTGRGTKWPRMERGAKWPATMEMGPKTGTSDEQICHLPHQKKKQGLVSSGLGGGSGRQPPGGLP